jgi:hypothetical protein
MMRAAAISSDMVTSAITLDEQGKKSMRDIPLDAGKRVGRCC